MISFTGLKTALRKFDECGTIAKCGDWSIANGGYDLYFEIYYQGKVVLQCISNELKGGFRPFKDFTEDTETELIKRVKAVYTDL